MDDAQKPDPPEGYTRTSKNDSGLSFEAEPTGLERDAPAGEAYKPARDSSRALLTPGEDVAPRSPFRVRPVSGAALAVLILVVLAVLLIWIM